MLETKPQRVLRCVIFSLAFFCPLAIIIENFERTKTGEAFTAAVARNSILANSIFRYFSIQLSIFKLSKAGKANTWKKASAGQSTRKTKAGREGERDSCSESETDRY